MGNFLYVQVWTFLKRGTLANLYGNDLKMPVKGRKRGRMRNIFLRYLFYIWRNSFIFIPSSYFKVVMEYHLSTKIEWKYSNDFLFPWKLLFCNVTGSLYKIYMGAAWNAGCGSGSCGDASGKRGNDFAHSFASCADKGSGRWIPHFSIQ